MQGITSHGDAYSARGVACQVRSQRGDQDESVIRHSPPEARATAAACLRLGIQSPYIPLILSAAVGAVTTVLVMNVPAFTRADVAGGLRQRRRFTGEEPLATVFLRRLLTA
jgi:hypothetical protein